ncbi:response regulator, partial [Cronbergia sp. UHCC 0137]|uniref:hybrid sensor histidine kinase/response regulator n=1 Tax=Cronbergia sp. UHCC 0137 TaxID=3110239 RepID=UPI002B209ABD
LNSEEFNTFWHEPNTNSEIEDNSTLDQDVARELEESLFAAASEEIFTDKQKSQSSYDFYLEEFDFSKPERSLDVKSTSDAKDDLFADLAQEDANSLTTIIEKGEFLFQEIQSFSQEPEVLDLMPEFTSNSPEAIAEVETFAQVDLFDTLDENSNENLLLSLDDLDQSNSTDFTPDNLLVTDNNLDLILTHQTQGEIENLEQLTDSLSLESFANLSFPELESNIIQTNIDDIHFDEVAWGEIEEINTQVTSPEELAIESITGTIPALESNIIQANIDDFHFDEVTLGEIEEINTQITSSEELAIESITGTIEEEFADLEALLGAELTGNTNGVLSLENEDYLQDEGEFADLEALLGAELTGNTNDVLSLENEDYLQDEDEFANLEALLSGELTADTNEPVSMPEDDFAALQALLGEEETQATQPVKQGVSQPLYFPSHNAVSASVVEDEFSKLEELLAAADQKISHAPTSPQQLNTSRVPRPAARRVMREETMKVSVKHLDDMSNLVGELVVNRNTLEQDHERLRQSLDNLLIQVQHLSDVGGRMQELYERSLLEASLLASRKSREQGYTFGSAPHPANDRGFSELEMDRFTPFHMLAQDMIEFIVRVRESASDIDFVTEETETVVRQFRQSTNQLQEGLTKARMVPFAQVVDRLRRGVRDNALKYGKEVRLVAEGTETLIDKRILDHLANPLTHMLNNAISHGIETPDIRQAAGKPPIGVISVHAFHQGNQTVIAVTDDGAGIDHEKVKNKAIQKGIISPEEAEGMSRIDIYDLLFLPSFSTADEVDDMKGRGVGMNIVHTDISEIRGTVTTDSVLGNGTTFTIRLPLTLSICKALCCVSDKARIAFPMDGVEDTLDIPLKSIQQDANGQSFIFWRDTVLPFKPLNEILAFNRVLSRSIVYGGNRDDDMVSVVVVRSGSTMVALQIDQVLNEQEIVIKQFEGPAPKPNGVAGATVLGDGRIMPIADVLEILDIFQGKRSKQIGGSSWQQTTIPPTPVVTPDVKIDPTVLIIDDSITVRELLSLSFNKAGYRVEQARDGQEAWEKLRAGLPCDIIFCDIEMPRCDGLELLSRIQKDPSLNHLPIAMLTSRGADKHKQMAFQLGASGYFTKPYLEEALLEAASQMLKGEKLITV